MRYAPCLAAPSPMPSSLLIATDFSPSSAAAFEEARWLGEQLGITPEILHGAEDNAADEWRHHPSARLWLATTGLEESAVITRSGIPWVEIVRRAQETGAALLIIGSHGQSGFHPLRLGSRSEEHTSELQSHSFISYAVF